MLLPRVPLPSSPQLYFIAPYIPASSQGFLNAACFTSNWHKDKSDEFNYTNLESTSEGNKMEGGSWSPFLITPWRMHLYLSHQAAHSDPNILCSLRINLLPSCFHLPGIPILLPLLFQVPLPNIRDLITCTFSARLSRFLQNNLTVCSQNTILMLLQYGPAYFISIICL